MFLRIASALLLCAFCASTLFAQDRRDEEVIRIETRLVSVPVIVSDRDGRYIPGLSQKDFAILQDGREQRIEFFGANDEPLTIALLIDTSRSTRPVLDDIKEAARSFIKLLGPKDRAMIVSFDRDVHELCELTSDQEILKKAIKNASIPDPIGTVLRDAVFQTIFTTFAELTGRKAVIVLSDGRDGGSHVSTRDLLTKLQETDTLVYTVQFRTEDRLQMEKMLRTGTIPRRTEASVNRQTKERVKEENAGDFLRTVSTITAGRFYNSETTKLKETFDLIVDELRRQYRLGFYPPEGLADTTLHEVKVRVARPNLVVRARGSYRLLSRSR